MPQPPPRFLLEGPPGVGKTTLVRRLVQRLQDAGVPVGGFTTQEVREHGRRVGFQVQAIGGPAALLAHTAFTSGPQVGRYHVDVAAFERVALPALEQASRDSLVIVVDEIGRMELASDAFVHAVYTLLEWPVAAVATVHARPHPVTDALKARPGLRRLAVTPQTRGRLLELLTGLLVNQP